MIRTHADPDLPALGALSVERWETIGKNGIPGLDRTLSARVNHVVMEVDRVRRGERAIAASDWPTFGALMTASGRSSAGLYEISHPLVEELVADLLALPGVVGARMMGGGEGGPALALLRAQAVDDVGLALRQGFFERHSSGDNADPFRVCVFGPGARLIPA